MGCTSSKSGKKLNQKEVQQQEQTNTPQEKQNDLLIQETNLPIPDQKQQSQSLNIPKNTCDLNEKLLFLLSENLNKELNKPDSYINLQDIIQKLILESEKTQILSSLNDQILIKNGQILKKYKQTICLDITSDLREILDKQKQFLMKVIQDGPQTNDPSPDNSPPYNAQTPLNFNNEQNQDDQILEKNNYQKFTKICDDLIQVYLETYQILLTFTEEQQDGKLYPIQNTEHILKQKYQNISKEIDNIKKSEDMNKSKETTDDYLSNLYGNIMQPLPQSTLEDKKDGNYNNQEILQIENTNNIENIRKSSACYLDDLYQQAAVIPQMVNEQERKFSLDNNQVVALQDCEHPTQQAKQFTSKQNIQQEQN